MTLNNLDSLIPINVLTEDDSFPDMPSSILINPTKIYKKKINDILENVNSNNAKIVTKLFFIL